VSSSFDFKLVLNASSENKASSTGKGTGAALLTAAGDVEADGAGLPAMIELVLLPGSVAQATARVERARVSPIAVCLIILILKYLINDIYSCRRFLMVLGLFPYFVLLTGLILGEGDAAGEGLAAGLGLVAGGAAVSPAGEDDVAGDVVLAGEFVLAAGSQADTNAIARIVVSRSMI
jgi:hypothetical protein